MASNVFSSFVNDAKKFGSVKGVICEFSMGSSVWVMSFILRLYFVRIGPCFVMNTTKAS